MEAKAPKRPVDVAGIDDTPSETSPQGLIVVARSCRSCHRRKVRCDRGVPCANCSRYDIPCEYPTKDTNVATRTPTLHDLANSLERVELLLARLVGRSQKTPGVAKDGGGHSNRCGAGQPRAQARSNVQVDKNGSANLPHSFPHHFKSTWDLLRKKEQAGRQGDSSSGEDSPDEVRLQFSFEPLTASSLDAATCTI